MLNNFFEILLDAFLDSIITLPVLFVCYMLIELLEEKILRKYQKNNLLKSKYAPIISAGFGIIPQCGFSVVASDLYGKRLITLGSLFAILIATSDEALPLMLSDPSMYLDLLLILSIKFVYACLIGFLVDFILKLIRQKGSNIEPIHNSNQEIVEIDEIHGCCKHELEHNKNGRMKELVIHPLVHSLKIFLFIFVINIIFGCIVEWIGEEAISNAMMSTGFFEPFIVSLVGLIPNCAASVIITELFIAKGISLGACIAGLSINSGLALIMLFKFNKNTKENLAIIFSLYMLSCILGLVVNIF